MVAAVIAAGFPGIFTVCAVVSPSDAGASCVREEVLTVGAKVYMFHSGTHDVQSAIRIGDVLTVYHDYPPDPLAATKQTGMVKVISTIGNYYFLGHVIEGVVQPGSLAMKGTTACIITFQPKQK